MRRVTASENCVSLRAVVGTILYHNRFSRDPPPPRHPSLRMKLSASLCPVFTVPQFGMR